MIIIMNAKSQDDQIKRVVDAVESKGLEVNLSKGSAYCIVGCIGDTSILDPDKLLMFDGVEKVLKVQEPYKKANKLFKPEPSIVDINGTKIGGGYLGIMAGPCSVEIKLSISVHLLSR